MDVTRNVKLSKSYNLDMPLKFSLLRIDIYMIDKFLRGDEKFQRLFSLPPIFTVTLVI